VAHDYDYDYGKSIGTRLVVLTQPPSIGNPDESSSHRPAHSNIDQALVGIPRMADSFSIAVNTYIHLFSDHHPLAVVADEACSFGILRSRENAFYGLPGRVSTMSTMHTNA
jgi:hypothetical protein